jgi:hypothetical protein
MKIVLTQQEFETMASAWVYENLVEKKMLSAKIVGDDVQLEVFSAGDEPEPPTMADLSEDNDDD